MGSSFYEANGKLIQNLGYAENELTSIQVQTTSMQYFSDCRCIQGYFSLWNDGDAIYRVIASAQDHRALINIIGAQLVHPTERKRYVELNFVVCNNHHECVVLIPSSECCGI